MKNNFKRCIAMLLAIMMVVGACAFPISAADDTNATETPKTTACEKCGETAKLVRSHEGDCTTQAFELYRCETCGYDFMTNVGAFGDHEWVTVDPVTDTCVDGVIGHNGGEQCSVCKTWKPGHTETDKQCDPAVCVKGADGVVVHDVTADSCMHTWDDGVITNGLVCTDGNVVTEFTCSVCAIKQVNTEVNTGTHSFEFIWDVNDGFVLPTCTEKGQVRRVCTKCDCEQSCAGTVVVVVIAAIGHDFTYVNDDPATTQHNQNCSRCDEFDGPADHTPDTKNNYTAATCGTAGKATCLDCGVEYVIPATLVHDYATKGTPVYTDCISKGTRIDTCACGATTTVEVTAQGHSYNTDPDKIDNPSHTFDKDTGKDTLTNGLKTWYCTRNCGAADATKTEEIKAEHDFSAGFSHTQSATCENHANKQYGITVYVCTCGFSKTEVVEPFACTFKSKDANGNDIAPVFVKKEYNCTTGGYNYYECISCKAPVKDTENPLAPGQHNVPDSWTTSVAPGHNVVGYYTKTCSICLNIVDSYTDNAPGSVCNFGLATEAGSNYFKCGDTCLTGWFEYKWCDTPGCPYYFDDSDWDNKTDAEKKALLDAACMNSEELRSKYVYTAPIGHSVNLKDAMNLPEDQLTVIKPATCTTDGLLGVECTNEGCPLPENERVVGVKVIRHEDHVSAHGDKVVAEINGVKIYNWMDLDEFVWSCSATDVREFTSVYRCVKCSAKQVLVTSYIPKDGLELVISNNVADYSAPDAVVTDADTAKFTKEVRVIKIYVNGKLTVSYDAADIDWTDATVVAPSITFANDSGDIIIANSGEHKDKVVPGKEATCAVEGEKQCALCQRLDVISKDEGHTYTQINRPNTCIDPGEKECTVCGDKQPIGTDNTKHTYGALTYPCKAEEKQCQNEYDGTKCTETTTVTATANHTSGMVAVDVCTGVWTTNCTVCSEPMTGTDTTKITHNFQNIVVEENLVSAATCQKPAIYKMVCANCDVASDKTFESGKPVYHNFTVETVAPEYLYTAAKCNAYAVYYKNCVWCNKAGSDAPTFEDVNGGYAAHTPENVTTYNPVNPKLCTEYTFTSVDVCTVCEVVLTIYGLDGNYGHESEEVADNAATCLRPAYKVYECKYCGTFDAETMNWEHEVEYGEKAFHKNASGYDLTGHCVYLPLVKDANGNIVYENDGVTPKTDYKCATVGCGMTINPDKHVWGTPVTDKHVTTTTCTVSGCGKTTTDTTPCNRDDYKINTEATATTPGEKEYFCTICGKSQGTELIEPIKTITLSLDKTGLNNQNVFVNGGKVYVTIYIDLDNTVTTTFVACNISLQINSDHLKFVKVVDNSSMFGVNTDAQQVGNTVAVYGMIGINDNPVAIPESKVFCVLEFDIIYTAGVYADRACEQDVKATDIDFGNVEIINENDAIMGVKATNGTTIEIDQVGDFDNDGKITAADATKLLREIEETFVTDGYYNAIADINRDGKLDIDDLTLMRKYLSMKIATYEEFAGFERSQYI